MPRLLAALSAAVLALLVTGTASAAPPTAPPGPPQEVRVATFNASLSRDLEGELVDDLADPFDEPQDDQVRAVAEIIQRVRPDVLLVNEFDVDLDGLAADRFRENFLEVGWGDEEPISYPYAFVAPSNTGLATGLDLNNDGVVGDEVGTFAYANDAQGFGFFPGQFGMLVLSQHPIDREAVRTFQTFLWADMPDNLLPDGFYSDEEQATLRLSSKSHWDLPIDTPSGTVHLLAAHPTPPVFDGPEDRNGRRNFDEIRFWADYVSPRPADAAYIYDDAGGTGGLAPGARFVIAGDYNADPFDGDSVAGAADQLLDAPLVRDPRPTSDGGVWAAETQGPPNGEHQGDPALDTADFAEAAFGGPGNLRVDYVLPSRHLPVRDAGVFWPAPDEDGFELTGPGFPPVSSDHRLVWVDVKVTGRR